MDLELEKKLAERMDGLLKSKRLRTQARNDLMGFISNDKSGVELVLNRSNSISWKKLVLCALEHDLSEIESNLNAQHPNNVFNKKIPHLLSPILSLQYENGNESAVNYVLPHLTEHLLSPDVATVNFIGTDYLQILGSWILDNHKIRCYLTQDKWNTIYQLMCSLQASPPHRLWTEVSQVFLNLVHLGYAYSCLPAYLILDSLSTVLCTFGYNKRIPYIRLITSLNLVTERSGANCRSLVCKTGEEMFNSVLNVLINGTFDNISEQILKYLILQIHFHHPSDVIESTYVTKSWIGSVNKLHQTMLESLKTQNRFFRYMSDPSFSSCNEFSLMSQLFFAMLVQVIRVFHIIELEFPNLNEYVSSVTKKVKLSSSNFPEFLSEQLSLGFHPNSLAFIRLLRLLLGRLPNLFRGRIANFIKHSCEIASKATGNLVHSLSLEVLKCLILIVSNQDLIQDSNAKDELFANISRHHIHFQKEPLFYKFLALYFEFDNQLEFPIVWSEMQHSLYFAETDYIRFLWEYISIRDLPSCKDITLQSTSDKHGSRLFLLNCLLPDKIDNNKHFIQWLVSCDHFFMLGQILASLSMKSCKKAIELTKHFFTDSSLRNHEQTEDIDYLSDNVLNVMLELEFLPFSPKSASSDIEIYTTKMSIIPGFYIEVIDHTIQLFFSIFTYLTSTDLSPSDESTGLISLIKYYFYFQFNLIIWSSYHLNPSTATFQGELAVLMFNQCSEYIMQSTPPSAVYKLEEFLIELRNLSLYSCQKQFYHQNAHYAISSLLNSIPIILVDYFKSHIWNNYSTQQQEFITLDTNPFDTTILSESTKESLAIIRILCTLHWLSIQVNSGIRDSLENFLVSKILSKQLDDMPKQTTKVFVLHADFAICEYFATSKFDCSQNCLVSILELLLVTSSKLHIFNQIAFKKIMSILTSLAHQLVRYIQSDKTITYLVENLLRIITQMYLNSRFNSTNKIAFIELAFLFYDIFSDRDWPTLSLQTNNSQETVEKPLKSLLYELNIGCDSSCFISYAKCIGNLLSSDRDLEYHLSCFFRIVESMSEINISTFLAHNLIPISNSDDVSLNQMKFIFVLLIKLALCSNRLSSSVVARMLNLAIKKRLDNEFIIRGLSRISNGLSYPDLSLYLSDNYESIFIEWLCLGLSVNNFPFQVFGLAEQQYIDKFAAKWMPLVLLTNDEAANKYLIQNLPKVESNADMLKFSFSEIADLILVSGPKDFQFPLIVLKNKYVTFSGYILTEAKDYISQHLPLNIRKELIKKNLESTLFHFFSKCIVSCSLNRKKEIESMLPPFFGNNIGISSLDEAFKINFNISLLSFFESDPYLLPRIHISLLKELSSSVQPYKFIYRLYSYCTFLQFITSHSSPTFETLTFLLNDSIYILFDLLRIDNDIPPNNSILQIRSKFAHWITHADTLTLLHTLISIYISVIPHVSDLVLNSVSILTDILCDYACSDSEDISTLSLHSLGEILTALLSEIKQPKPFFILIFIPSNPVLASLKSSIDELIGEYNGVEILRELAVHSWYSHMSCLTYLNQVKLHLTWFISSGHVNLCDVNELNLLFDQLIQKIHSTTMNSYQESRVPIILFELFVLLTPYYSRCRVTVECKSLEIFSKRLNLNQTLYHIPILLFRLSQLIHSSDIHLKELAYDILHVISNSKSVQSVIDSLEKAAEFSYSSFPFTSSLVKKSKKSTKSTSNRSLETNHDIPFEIPNRNSIDSTKKWLQDLSLLLVDCFVQDPVLMSTRPIIQAHYESAREFLKLYVYDVILGENETKLSILSNHINNGFKQAFDCVLDVNSNESSVNVYAIRILLEIVHFLRRKSLFDDSPRGYFKNNFLLKLNYLYIASSSFICKDYHSTLLFLHIYSDPLRARYLPLPPIHGEELVIQELLIKTYGELGEIECVNSVACNSLNLEFQKAKMTGNWPEVIQMCSNFPFNKVTTSQDLCEAMHRMGWYSFSQQQASDTDNAFLSDLNYESVWRLSLWDDNLPEMPSKTVIQPSPQQVIFENIQAFKDRDISHIRACIESNARHIVRDFLRCNEGSIFNISKLLSNVSILNTLYDFSFFTESVFANKLKTTDFPTIPPLVAPKDFIKDILSIRISLLSKIVDFLKFEGFCDEMYLKQFFELIFNDVIIAVKLARKSKQGSEANNLLHALELCFNKMEHSLPRAFTQEFNYRIKLEYSKVKFLQNDFQTCFSILKHNSTCLQQDPSQFSEIYCYLLTLYGTLLGEKQQETSLNIISEYLEKSVHILRQLEYDFPSATQVRLLEKAHFSLAQYTDQQYNVIIEYLNSPEYGTKLKLTHTFEKMGKMNLDATDGQNQVQLDQQKGVKLANIHASEYRQQKSEITHDKSEFLKKALENYCFCLELGDRHDMCVSRVISLWFDNYDNPNVAQLLSDHFGIISTHKFIPWVFQIIPRLSFISSEVNTFFAMTLTSLVYRIAKDHPYHCLPIIFAILHFPLDSIFTDNSNKYRYGDLSKSEYNLNNAYLPPRFQEIVEIIRREKGEIVQRMKNLFIDLVELGYHNYNLSTSATKSNELPKNCSLLKESALRDIPIFTREIPVSLNNDYSNLKTIFRFNSKYSVPGGISHPKLLTCIGSDGIKYKILLKGREDLRKDAVIQQAFGVINRLLAQDKWFNEKCVGIRTYKIVPLSQGSGLISWCEGAVSLAQYLINTSGAHQRYYPHDERSDICQELFKASENKLKTYQFICDSFHPVFRFFFFEKFLDAPTWLQRRMQYTRSVAVASMAGYILGIGDRHTENILIDASTAEIIHIDFGELFDSGKLLAVPEKVPFRLTRDLVDPMGDLGKDGIFRPCCEETLRIIRLSKEYIKTVLKVLLYAPLHKWEIMQNCIKSSLVKQSSQNLQSCLSLGGEDANEIALRVLLRINEKIDGIERNTPLSIAGQVNLLISEATDEVRLSSMFFGWKPWV